VTVFSIERLVGLNSSHGGIRGTEITELTSLFALWPPHLSDLCENCSNSQLITQTQNSKLISFGFGVRVFGCEGNWGKRGKAYNSLKGGKMSLLAGFSAQREVFLICPDSEEVIRLSECVIDLLDRCWSL
jgi:hypothetical protein